MNRNRWWKSRFIILARTTREMDNDGVDSSEWDNGGTDNDDMDDGGGLDGGHDGDLDNTGSIVRWNDAPHLLLENIDFPK